MYLVRMTASKVGLPKATHSSRFLQMGSYHRRVQRIRSRSVNQQQHRYTSSSGGGGGHHQHQNSDPFVRPYSDSLPAEGYEWCTRCNIRCHKFQKKIGQHNTCLDSPRLFGLGICSAAKDYWKRRVLTMIALGSICFMPLPSSSSSSDQSNFSMEDSGSEWRDKQEMSVIS